jgi:Domain of unknown function (DUF4349)
MNRSIALALGLAIALLSACGGAAPTSVSPEAPSFAASEPAPPATGGAPGLESAKDAPAPAEQQVANTDQVGVARLVIKTASLTLEVEDVRAAEAAIRAKVGELQGYVVTAQSNGTEPNLYINITFRVPSDKFDSALSDVQGLANKVLSRTLGGEDVTEEFVDLESRLRNLEATRVRLLDLLQKANRVEDALSVNQALTDVQGQIEQITGRMKYLQQSAAMATITVALQPVPNTPIIEEDSWQPLRVARGALRELIEFGEGIANLAIVLLVWSPVWLVIFVVARWIWKKLARAMRRPITPAAPTTPVAPSAPSDSPESK